MAELGTDAETRRLQVLAAYAIVDTPSEVEFDDVARLAADICEAPMAVISLIDATRQWFKARVGITVNETPRDIAFCEHALDGPQLLEVENAAIDPRFSDNPLVTGEPLIRHYAGAPLLTAEGLVLGTLAVLDIRPRRLNQRQRRALEVLSRQVMQQLELRRQLLERAQIERQLQQRLHQQALLAKLGLTAVAATSVAELLRGALATITETLGVEFCALLQLMPNAAVLKTLASHGWGSQLESVVLPIHPAGEAAFLLASEQPVYVPDYHAERRFHAHPGILRAGIVSGMSVAVRVQGRPWGTLTAHSRSARAFSTDDTAFMQTVATLLATSIDRLTVQQQLRDSERNMHIAQQLAHMGNWEVANGVTRWSEELYNIFGVDVANDAPSGEAIFRFIHPDDHVAVRLYIENMLRGDLADVEYRIVRCNAAEVRYLRERGRRVESTADASRFLGTVLDITDLKRAELTLQENSALLEIASDAALLGGWKLDLAAQRLIWSDAVRRIYEVPADYQPDLASSLNYYPPDSRALIQAAVETCCAQGTPFDVEVPFITARGRELWVRAIGRARHEADGTIRAIQGAFQDISHRKANEAKIQKLAAQLETTLESITDAFFTLDRDWRFTYLNRRAEQFIQHRREDLIGHTLWDAFETIRTTVFFAEYQRALATGETVSFVALFEPLQAWYEVTAYPMTDGLAVYFRLVNDRVQQEQKLRQQALLLDQAKDAILVRGLDHRIQFWNKAAERLYGWSSAEAVQRSIEDLLYPDDNRDFRAAMARVLATGEWSGRLQQCRRDGTAITIEGHWTLVRNEAGEPQSILAINTDISERLDLEGRLAQSQKLESIGQLTGGIAHDFNNLLTVIIGNIELLAETFEPDDPLMPIINLVSTAADRGAELTSRLLSFARRQALEPKIISPTTLIRNMAPLLERTLGESSEIKLFHESGLWDVLADPTQFESALLNLCLNARDAMPGGGKLTIDTANIVLDESYVSQHADLTPGPYVRISVTDTGMGMTPETASRVFDPFFTTKEKGKGTGLGLSMVYGFAKQSNGHIKLYSELGHGSAFHLYLPRAHGAAVPDIPESNYAQPFTASEHILLVEDDERVRDHAASLLKVMGYRVTEAADGVTALKLVREGLAIDLLFTDVIMPGGINGAQLAGAVQKLIPGLPVLFASGYTENAILHNGRVDAGVLLLQKPYRRATLAEKIRQALQGNNAARETRNDDN